MPVRYIGKRCADFGLPLWEIVMNLKNFGVGRIVERVTSTRTYPEEPTYFRIVKAEPHTIEYHPGEMRGDLWVEMTFRGRKYQAPQNISNVAYLPDFRLINKHEEDAFCKRGKVRLEPPHIVPSEGTLPPLWRELILRQNPGMDPDQVPKMKMIYRHGLNQLLHVAEEGETPSYEILPQHVRPVRPELYKDVIFSRDEAVAFYNEKNNQKKASAAAAASSSHPPEL